MVSDKFKAILRRKGRFDRLKEIELAEAKESSSPSSKVEASNELINPPGRLIGYSRCVGVTISIPIELKNYCKERGGLSKTIRLALEKLKRNNAVNNTETKKEGVIGE